MIETPETPETPKADSEYWDSIAGAFKASSYQELSSMQMLYSLGGAYTAKHTLEMGCGSGIGAASVCSIHPKPFTFYAVDNSPQMLASTLQAFHPLQDSLQVSAQITGLVGEVQGLAQGEGEGGQVRIMRVDGVSLPFPGECFDSYVASHSMAFMVDREKALIEAYRVLREGGRLAFSGCADTHKSSYVRLMNEALSASGVEVGEHFYTAFSQCQYFYDNLDSTIQMLTQIGFKNIKYHLTQLPFPSLCANDRYESSRSGMLKHMLSAISIEMQEKYKEEFMRIGTEYLEQHNLFTMHHIFFACEK